MHADSHMHTQMNDQTPWPLNVSGT